MLFWMRVYVLAYFLKTVIPMTIEPSDPLKHHTDGLLLLLLPLKLPFSFFQVPPGLPGASGWEVQKDWVLVTLCH